MVKILKSGFYTTIQDLGRFGFQDNGVPFSGVMDRYAYKVANMLIGNDLNCSVLEITMTGPELQFNQETAICISGADMSPSLDDKAIFNNQVVNVTKGSILKFGKLKKGFRCYLAVKGGFQTETVMKSLSMYNGITSKSIIGKGDELKIESFSTKISKTHVSLKINSDYVSSKEIKAYKGPEYDLLSEKEKNLLATKTFTISKNYNRMAYQLEEPFKNTMDPIITSLVMPGTVQLTPSGQLIILMRDCQTTGGYPRVLQLDKSSINIMAQKYGGQQISFKLID